MRPVFNRKKWLLAFLLLAFFFFPLPANRVESQACQLVPVGQIPKRILEIHKELIFLFSAIEKEYAKMLSLTPELVELTDQCSIEPCQVTSCPAPCKPNKCDLGDPCGPPASGADLCPKDTREEIDELFPVIKGSYDKIKKVEIEILKLSAELTFLEGQLANSKVRLAGYNPNTHFLYSCNEAKSQHLVETCSKEELKILGLVIPLPDQPDSGFDYYLCPR